MLSTTLRRTAAALVALVLVTGCSDLNEASASPGLSHTDVVADLAAQLSGAANRTYEATYQLAGGETATIAQGQQPARAAYVYPGGKVLLTTDATTECRTGTKPATCTMTAPATPTSPPPPAVFRGADTSGMVTPVTVIGLLNRAALDADAEVTQHDTTIAGRHATCVELTGVDGAAARDFRTCVTNEGVLGSFSGVLHQARVEVAMTHYADRLSENLFDLPKAAKLIDQRR
ncbi:hypothetical protein [Couchioplanes caeruleus]|uniref:Lipoprotein n=2 Tax=Couchioplanes caeruleus TaxID=56438 RepID=A0A1K0FPR2_9ACTN|nr:hypothetical protein [Couchioplanes caeruleus]OJF14696.1 hypothetical protein BG844_08665 [Couchioplanes caeruleus subsp. caeruleus]ROP30098.1 hypothetical protein EDD30_2931 [Couchioplanes caeruleus]